MTSPDTSIQQNTRFQAVVFDLDGTLLNTLADIAAAGNHVLKTFHLPPRPVGDYRHLAGQGVRWLVEQALGPELAHRVDQGVALLKAYQLEHGLDHTQPYEGIGELLDEFTRRTIPITILSNKPDPATHTAVHEKLNRWRFAIVQGARDGEPLKPDPAGAIAIAQTLEVQPSRVLYVGDTRADMLTAKAAGMFAAGVLWGFREQRELRDAGADVIVQRPRDLMDLL